MRAIFKMILVVLFLLSCMDVKEKKKIQIVEEKTTALWVDYKASEDRNEKFVLLVSGDEEYRSEEALPQLARILTERHGFDCSVLFAQDPEKPGIIDPNYRFNIPGLHLLEKADLVIWFTPISRTTTRPDTIFRELFDGRKTVYWNQNCHTCF